MAFVEEEVLSGSKQSGRTSCRSILDYSSRAFVACLRRPGSAYGIWWLSQYQARIDSGEVTTLPHPDKSTSFTDVTLCSSALLSIGNSSQPHLNALLIIMQIYVGALAVVACGLRSQGNPPATLSRSKAIPPIEIPYSDAVQGRIHHHFFSILGLPTNYLRLFRQPPRRFSQPSSIFLLGCLWNSVTL